MDRSVVRDIVLEAVRDQLALDGADPGLEVTEQTPLIGDGALIDSLGLVTVIVDVEERLAGEHGISVMLVDEKAMSERYSPFRTVATLTDYTIAAAGGPASGERP